MRFALRSDAIPLLLNLPNPTTREAALDKTQRDTGAAREDLERFFDALVGAGIVVPEGRETGQPAHLQQNFASLRGHATMLNDAARCLAFERALRLAVRPDDVVIDVGAGTGILSFFAARAGARKVHGLEISRIAVSARQFAEQNALSDRVEFIEADAAELALDVKADVIVGEWVGLYVYDEWKHLDAFARVRDAHLREGGRLVPEGMNILVAPVDSDEAYGHSGYGVWRNNLYGFDFRVAGPEGAAKRRRPLGILLPPRALAAPLAVLQHLDCYTEDSRSYPGTRDVDFQIDRTRTIHGFVFSFELELSGRVALDASPSGVPTCWRHAFLAMDPIPVVAGDVLKCRFTTTIPVDGGPRTDGVPLLVIRVEAMRGDRSVATSEHEFAMSAG